MRNSGTPEGRMDVPVTTRGDSDTFTYLVSGDSHISPTPALTRNSLEFTSSGYDRLQLNPRLTFKKRATLDRCIIRDNIGRIRRKVLYSPFPIPYPHWKQSYPKLTLTQDEYRQLYLSFGENAEGENAKFTLCVSGSVQWRILRIPTAEFSLKRRPSDRKINPVFLQGISIGIVIVDQANPPIHPRRKVISLQPRQPQSDGD